MRSELRLRRRKDFDNVFRGGRVWSNNLLVLRSLATDLPNNRFGFVRINAGKEAAAQYFDRFVFLSRIKERCLARGYAACFGHE